MKAFARLCPQYLIFLGGYAVWYCFLADYFVDCFTVGDFADYFIPLLALSWD